MIKGIDVGNSITKDDLGNQFESRYSTVSNILGNTAKLTLNGETYYLEEGNYDTEYRKVSKENYLKMLFGILALSNADSNLQVVLGLPISQYKTDKEHLKQLILDNRLLVGSFNNKPIQYIIEDVEVYPEGIASASTGYEGIIVDVGGRTTDCCLTYLNNNVRKIENPISIAQGTLNLYSSFINELNSKYCLDLKPSDSSRILKSGLSVSGVRQDISFAVNNTFKLFLEDLIKKLNVEYSLKTNRVFFTGGGSLLLKKSILNRLSYAEISEDALLDNAKGFHKRGVQLWG